MKPQSWREIERTLKAAGAVFVSSCGDHFKWRMPNGNSVTVPHPKHEVPIGTTLKIYRDAGLR